MTFLEKLGEFQYDYNFSRRLKEARERLNLKQKDIQERIGINNRTLSGYETGKTEPDNTTLLALSNLYKVSVDWLMGRVDFSGLQDMQVKENQVQSNYLVNRLNYILMVSF